MKGSVLINKYILDVIGVVKSTSDMQTIVSKASQKEFNKRDVLLVDEKASISVTLWGQQVNGIFCGQNKIFFDGFSSRLKNLMVHQIQ
jgi:ssDNA-binding replication factor A large subunit